MLGSDNMLQGPYATAFEWHLGNSFAVECVGKCLQHELNVTQILLKVKVKHASMNNTDTNNYAVKDDNQFFWKLHSSFLDPLSGTLSLSSSLWEWLNSDFQTSSEIALLAHNYFWSIRTKICAKSVTVLFYIESITVFYGLSILELGWSVLTYY